MSQLIEILEKFQNGETRYGEDHGFANVIDSLRLGLGVYAVLDKVLREQKALRAAYELERLENENLRASNRSVIESNIRLTEKVQYYESY